jgi:hypothetical protein
VTNDLCRRLRAKGCPTARRRRVMRLLPWLVAATATTEDRHRRLSARDRQTTKGLLPNDIPREPQRWVFVHIPKAAGASFMIDARHFITRRDTITGSEEKGAFSRTTLRKLEGESGMRAILLRRPLQLVYSQFLYCKHVLKGKVKDFPGHGQDPAWVGVKEWSNGAKKVTAEWGPFWNCYYPRNVQFRFVVGEGSALTNKGVSSKISVDDASRKLDGEFGLVGFVELYRESLCLLGWRATKQVPSYCRCGAEGPLFGAKFPPTSTTHREAYDSSLDKVPSSVQASLNKLVERDELLYLHGLFVFERAVKETGAQLVCPGKMERLWSSALRDACRPSTSQYIREHYNKSCPVVRKSLGQKVIEGVNAVVEHALEVRTRNDRAMRHLKHVAKAHS